MKGKSINRKEFFSALGKFGVGTCLCAAAAGMHATPSGEALPSHPSQTTPPPKNVEETKPGDKTVARQAMRMEFGDVWLWPIIEPEIWRWRARSMKK